MRLPINKSLIWQSVKRRLRYSAEYFFGPRPLQPVNDRPFRDSTDTVMIDWPDNTPKPRVGLVKDKFTPPYWTKYQKFLEDNSIPYEFYDIHRSDWLDAADSFDVVIWRVESSPGALEHARRKLFALEKLKPTITFPSFDASMIYEDKILQWEILKTLGYPVIDTFITNDMHEAREFVNSAAFPLVSKIVTGSGSQGVEHLSNAKQARRIINKNFSRRGRATYWPYVRQQGYILLQPLVPNQGYDLRIITIGKRTFGYFRFPPAKDYRASGIGTVRMDELPRDAIELARSVTRALGQEMLAVDFLRKVDGTLAIIEVSSFVRVDSPRQLEIAGKAGAYVLQSNGDYLFEQGTWWPQELALAEFLEKRWLKEGDTLKQFERNNF